MSNSYTITLATTSSGNFVPVVLTTTPVLVATGNATIKHLGIQLKPGVYEFGASTAVDDGKYKLYESDGGAEIISWGGTNGKWIGDDNMEIYAKVGANNTFTGNNIYSGSSTFRGTNAFTVACPISYVAPTATDHLTRKDYVDNISASLETHINTISSSLESHILSVSASLESHILSVSSSISTIDTSQFLVKSSSTYTTQIINNPVRFNFTVPPVCDKVPTVNNQLTNMGYVDSEITNRIALSTGNYQESPNIVRLIPNGSSTGSMATSWSDALSKCSTATSTKQYTVLITGEGTSANSVDMTSSGSIYVKDYVHWKGLGSDIKINTTGNTTLSGTNFTTITMENLEFYFNDSENPFNFSGITFKNCKFSENETAGGVTFTDCRFEGGNYFYAASGDNVYSFLNCFGERIYTVNEITVSGINKIQYYTNTKFNIGVNTITDNISYLMSNVAFGCNNDLILNSFEYDAPATVTYDSNFNNVFGTMINNTGLAEPNKWIKITVDGNPYVIPLYDSK